jgi:hypothetical protein
MGAIAGSALAFAFLPTLLSVAFTVTVLGILVLKGMHLPLVTDEGGMWRWFPWVLWSLALMACPAAIPIVGALYEYQGPPDYNRWAYRVVNGLGFAQLSISVIASVSVVVLARGAYRWLAWAAVLAIGALTVLLHLGAAMATTGAYL